MTITVWQWDVDKTVSWCDLQVGQRVNFAQDSTSGAEAYVVLAYEKDGKVVADIPNDMLQVAEEIRAYEMQNDPYQTILRLRINVKERERPQDYIYEPTQVQTWEDVLTVAEQAISAQASTAENAEIAQTSATNAQTYASNAHTDATSAEESATNAHLYALNAEAFANQAEQAADSVSVATLAETLEYVIGE